METGTRAAPDTPPAARRIQRSINLLGVVNLVSGVGLVASTGLFWRSAVSRPPLRRGLLRSSRR